MEENANPIQELEDRLEALRIKQGLLADEIINLSRSLRRLKADTVKQDEVIAASEEVVPVVERNPKSPVVPAEEVAPQPEAVGAKDEKTIEDRKKPISSVLSDLNENLEDFIGASLISKIGIIAIVFGVGIGVKYAFDHDLISPPIRILMGYLAGGVLLFFAYRFQKAYRAFSAVLLSGALAIAYYTSFAAHDYYELFPQGLTFAVMVLLTMYAVGEALRTDQPVIAHFGLVGAYAVPYLLGDDPDQIGFLFTYIAIVNIGILAISLWRYWKKLYYAAFGITWLIYATWFTFDYRESTHYNEALLYLSVFFAIFYLTFLAYKLIRQEKYQTADVALVLLNSFIFYGLGYVILQDHDTGQHQLGLFTMINALIHFGVSVLVYQFRLADRNLFYLVAGVGLIFATITIPVQLDGSWVTFLWAGEALLLFWIGRSRGAPTFEKLSYALFPLAFLSLLEDWTVYGSRSEVITPVFNIYLFTSLWTASCFGLSQWINNKTQYPHALRAGRPARNLFDYGLAVIFLMTLYFSFLLEITHYFEELRRDVEGSNVLMRYQFIWAINYTLFFLAILSLINIFRLRSSELGIINLTLTLLAVSIFTLGSLSQFADLQEVYGNTALKHSGNSWDILIRYVSYLFAGGLLWTAWHQIRQEFMKVKPQKIFEIFLHLVILAVLSLELYCWMEMLNISNSFQAGLSIIWGIYALLLIGLGIRWRRKYLRIVAMVLVGVTLLKVALVDLAGLDTPTKTVVLIVLGALLLGISFLYNRFRGVLFDSSQET